MKHFVPKTDCFAYMTNKKYKSGGACTCLNALYCATEDCKFYKRRNEEKRNLDDKKNNNKLS